METNSKNKITVEAAIKTPLEKVWQLWNEPRHIERWNFASDDWHCPKAENDLKAGGKLRSRMEAKDGSMGFDFEAIYDEVIPQQKVSYTMGDGRQATTIFEAKEGRTKVSTSFDPETMNSPEMQQAGWQAILDNFKKYAEGTV